jgi:hypothetical protein
MVNTDCTNAGAPALLSGGVEYPTWNQKNNGGVMAKGGSGGHGSGNAGSGGQSGGGGGSTGGGTGSRGHWAARERVTQVTPNPASPLFLVSNSAKTVAKSSMLASNRKVVSNMVLGIQGDDGGCVRTGGGAKGRWHGVEKSFERWQKVPGSTVETMNASRPRKSGGGDAEWQSREIRTNLKHEAKGEVWVNSATNAVQALDAAVLIRLLQSMGLFDSLTGVSEKEVKGWARDYERGYEAGSQQRLADEIRRDRDK